MANSYLIYDGVSATTWENTPIPTTDGGTGLATLGTAGQVLAVNPGATGLVYSNAASGTVTTTGTPTSGQIALFSGSSSITGTASPLGILNGGTGQASATAAFAALIAGSTVGIGNGGTGQVTAQAAYNALAPSALTPLLGDVQYFDGTNWVVLPAPVAADYTAANGPVVMTFTGVGIAPAYQAG